MTHRHFHNQERLPQRGAVLLETAVFSLLVLFIIAGILDFGYVFRQSAIIYQASRSGARTAGAKTADKSVPALMYWCNTNQETPTAWASCDDVLRGEFPPLPHGGDTLDQPLQSALYMSCHYLSVAGLSPVEWETQVQAPIRLTESGFSGGWIKLSVRKRTDARRCLLCLQRQFESLILSETSVFPVQCDS